VTENPPATQVETSNRRLRLRQHRLDSVRDYGIVGSFIALFATLSLASPIFLTQLNLDNVLDQSAQVGIMACGETIVFIAGGFDLSIGAVFALSGVVAAEASLHHAPTNIALLLGLLVGVGVGIVNGLLTTVGRINAFITTIATQFIVYGLALAVTGGLLVTATAPSFTNIGDGYFHLISYQTFIWLGLAAVFGLLLWRTALGRYIYASGGNAEAARLAGVSVSVTRVIAFTLSGLAAALAGVLDVSRTSTGEPSAAAGIELTVIAAVVIGGTSIYGGEGAIWRTVLGVLLLTLIGNGFDLLNVDATYQQIIQGGIILAAVGVDSWSRRSS
jgi:ribose transport system permease protein